MGELTDRVRQRWSAEHAAVALLTLAFVSLGSAFAVTTPLFQNPDETSQVDMVRHYAFYPTDMAGPALRQTRGVRDALLETGMTDIVGDRDISHLPASRPDYRTFEEYGGFEEATECPGTCQNYQFIHPPGWYLLAAPVVAALDSQPVTASVLALRLLNVVLVSVAVACTWYIARQLCPGRPRLALVAAALTAACAPLAATAAAVNSDGGMLALMAMALAGIARLLRRGLDTPTALFTGVVIGLGLLTKGQFLVIAPIGLAAVVLAPRTRPLWLPLLAHVVPVGLGGLWWLRVLLDTHGFTPAGSELVSRPSPGPWRDVGFLSYVRDRIPEFADQLPGRYGWKLITLPGWLAWATQAAGVLLFVGWLLARRWQRPTPASARVALLATLPPLLFVAAALAAFDTFHASGEIRGLAPRYTFGAIPVVAVGAAAAMATIAARVQLDRWRAWLGGLVVLLAAAWGAASFVAVLRGQYQSDALGTIFQRAGTVAPIARPKAWTAILTLLWLGATAASSALVVRIDTEPEPAPPVSRGTNVSS